MTILVNPYFCGMPLRSEYQELVDFFSASDLPTGPQHVNEYSVFLNLSGAVSSSLQRLQSEVEATSLSAARMLTEVKQWLVEQEVVE
ncbi:DUF6965 family protein [Spirosoma validum]|uniref:DUF6965 domain-containing protein n=1 Tax=Spirosoma validum TaxID=2771355 RepID=A0A927B2K4_9BACT|nr:hypothetical protein [Spirosoma validum]MBD2754158.1 hypothetical protein [Spirosoma validum]